MISKLKYLLLGVVLVGALVVPASASGQIVNNVDTFIAKDAAQPFHVTARANARIQVAGASATYPNGVIGGGNFSSLSRSDGGAVSGGQTHCWAYGDNIFDPNGAGVPALRMFESINGGVFTPKAAYWWTGRDINSGSSCQAAMYVHRHPSGTSYQFRGGSEFDLSGETMPGTQLWRCPSGGTYENGTACHGQPWQALDWEYFPPGFDYRAFTKQNSQVLAVVDQQVQVNGL